VLSPNPGKTKLSHMNNSYSLLSLMDQAYHIRRLETLIAGIDWATRHLDACCAIRLSYRDWLYTQKKLRSVLELSSCHWSSNQCSMNLWSVVREWSSSTFRLVRSHLLEMIPRYQLYVTSSKSPCPVGVRAKFYVTECQSAMASSTG